MSGRAMDLPEKSFRHLYQLSLITGLERLFSSENLSDVTIQAGSYTFKCHRVILSCLSPYFEAMFSSGMKESVTGLVKVEGIGGEIFKGILSYIYSGIDILKYTNAEAVLKAASLLQMECLQRPCEESLSRSLSMSNCLARWRLAYGHGCTHLSQNSWSYMMDHFTELSKTEEFLTLEGEELIRMLKDDYLSAGDEEFILDSAIRWVYFDEEDRTQHLPAIFQSVRLSLARPQFLVDVVRKHDMVRDCVEVLQAIDKAKNFQLLPSRRHDFTSDIMTPRKCSRWEDVLVVMSGGETPKTPYKRSNNVYAYSFSSQQWFYLAPLLADPGIEFASCVHGNDIHITGGGILQTCYMRYRAKKNKWSNCRAKLKNGRRRHAMVACGNKLYVIGGYNAELKQDARIQKSIEEYELDTGEWVEVCDLIKPVSSASATALGDRIFIFGGEKVDAMDTCMVQCFDTSLQTMSVVSPLPINCKLSRAVVFDNLAYIVLYDGKVLRFCPEENSSKIVGRIKNFDRVHFGVVQWRGNLYLLAGQRVEPPRSLCDDMLTYNVSTGVLMNMQSRVPTPRFLDSCAKITMDRKFLTKEVSIMEVPESPS